MPLLVAYCPSFVLICLWHCFVDLCLFSSEFYSSSLFHSTELNIQMVSGAHCPIICWVNMQIPSQFHLTFLIILLPCFLVKSYPFKLSRVSFRLCFIQPARPSMFRLVTLRRWRHACGRSAEAAPVQSTVSQLLPTIHTLLHRPLPRQLLQSLHFYTAATSKDLHPAQLLQQLTSVQLWYTFW